MWSCKAESNLQKSDDRDMCSCSVKCGLISEYLVWCDAGCDQVAQPRSSRTCLLPGQSSGTSVASDFILQLQHGASA
jgi:hypothetical protein